jgi:hypothetical protein
MTARIAQELIDWIIDNLHDDLKALCNCSLVASAWLPASRFHKFARLRIRSIFPQETHPRTFEAFPEAAEFVRDLTYQAHPIPWSKLTGISMCTRLHTLRLVDIDFTGWSSSSLPSRFPFHALVELKLLRCHFPGTQDYANFMSCFPNLECLSSAKTTFRREYADHAVYDEVELFSHLPGGLRLGSITLDGWAPDVDPLNAVLKQSGSDLEEFILLRVQETEEGVSALRGSFGIL